MAEACFTGRYALVTGGSQGAGRAITERFLAEGAAGVAIVGRDLAKAEATAAELSTDSARVVAIADDLATAGAPDRIMAAVEDAFGTVHAAVNAAALTVRGSVWDTTEDMWDAMLVTNVRAPGRITTLAADLMRRTGVAGAVTHIGSVAAAGGAPELFPYAASKQALVAMTKNSSFALLRHRIRVNLIQPGWMNTPAEDGIQRRFHGATDGWLAEASAKQPFGRLIDPAELARTVVFVSSDEAGLMTGAVIDYDQTILGPDMSRSDLEPVWGEPGGPHEGVSS